MGKLFSLPSEIARAIAAARRPKQRACLVCQQPFVTIGRGLYCSSRCKRRAYYHRHIEQERQRNRAAYQRHKLSKAGG